MCDLHVWKVINSFLLGIHSYNNSENEGEKERKRSARTVGEKYIEMKGKGL